MKVKVKRLSPSSGRKQKRLRRPSETCEELGPRILRGYKDQTYTFLEFKKSWHPYSDTSLSNLFSPDLCALSSSSRSRGK